jgi:SAM-dependent methyltransferase
MPGRLQAASGACPVCGSGDLRAVLELRAVPTQDGVLWRTAAEAKGSPVGDIRLVLCEGCSFVWNELYEPEKVQFQRYDVSLQHSPAFRNFVSELAERLISRYDLRHKRVLDIGCGRGHFLEAICARGPNAGVGIDPSVEPERRESPQLTLVRDAYGERWLDVRADLLSCRHVLDILADQPAFVRLLGRGLDAAGSGAVAYVEVPNALATFEALVVWNLVYEHRAWYVRDSLAYLFATAGFDVLDVAPCWHGEYLGLEARRARAGATPHPVAATESGVAQALDRFAASFERVRGDWQARLDALADSGRRAVVWGAGARGIAFLSLLDPRAVVPYVVDVNPKRQGLYLPQTAHRVEPPEQLLTDPPDLVVISNPTYADEITTQASTLGVTAELVTL